VDYREWSWIDFGSLEIANLAYGDAEFDAHSVEAAITSISVRSRRLMVKVGNG
jgi:hypothetical protein